MGFCTVFLYRKEARRHGAACLCAFVCEAQERIMNLKMITPYKIKKGFRYLLHFGPKEFMNHLLDRLEPEEVPYGPWFESHKAAEADLAAQRKKGVPGGPMFSVIVPA